MSTVETSLGANEMATSIEYNIESFRNVVDEAKDSDEESFHLFLDGDDDINNKNDINVKTNEQEEEKVNEPKKTENTNLKEEKSEKNKRKKKKKSSTSTKKNENSTETKERLSDASSEIPKTYGKSDEEKENPVSLNGNHIRENENSPKTTPVREDTSLNGDELENKFKPDKNAPARENSDSNNDSSSVTTEKSQSEVNKKYEMGPKSDENSVESSDELLDISLIKDSEQDDADIAEDARQLQRENEDSTSGTNQNDISKSTSTERMESETSDEDVRDETSGNGFQNNEIIKDEKLITEKNDTDNDQKMAASTPEGIDMVKLKRALSGDIPKSNSKKLKLEENENDIDLTEINSLISFSRFMSKTHLKKLTRADLEEFCVQKLCEAILHKSELGEMNHQVKLQEITIDNLRKDQAILTKRVRDLEIVNKKLILEVKQHQVNGSKPIVPIKITRSVGLQVRTSYIGDPASNIAKRKTNITPTKPQVSLIKKSPVQTPKPPKLTAMRKPPLKTNNTILSQAITNKTSPNNVHVIQTKPQGSPEKSRTRSFIDLTTEDDKKSKSTPKTSSKTGVLPAASTPQVMYVVQPNSQLKQGLFTSPGGQQKTVLLNFQPTNAVLNTPAVSVIPKVNNNNNTSSGASKTNNSVSKISHPAPLPNPPIVFVNKKLKGIPPRPVLSIRKTDTGIVLQWRMPYDLSHYEAIASYQLYAYQETTSPPDTDMWRKVGDVKAMALPMACTLTQFADKNKYYFAVRPVDVHMRIGKFSNPEEISL